MDQPIGHLRVTVVFDVPVYDLTHFESENLTEAAANAALWYADGSGDLIADLSCASSPTVTVTVAPDSASTEVAAP